MALGTGSWWNGRRPLPTAEEQMTDGAVKHRKKSKKKVKRPYTIEWKWDHSGFFGFEKEWTIYSRYATAKQRDQALAQMIKNANHNNKRGTNFQFRVGQDKED